MSIQQYFEENQYVVLEGALDQDRCRQLTNHMFDLHKQGKLINDEQCPVSDAIYGDPVLDKLLADFAKPIGDHVSKQLLPTYSYARIYRTGEILKKHKDRPSCEISATVQISTNHDEAWPIWFQHPDQTENTVSMKNGDMVIYKGCEREHWREPLTGKDSYHHQIFFHYVNAQGPYVHYAYDRGVG